MAAKAQEASSTTSTTTNNPEQKTITFLKTLTESPDLTSIPSSYAFITKKPDTKDEEILEEEEIKFPIIDFSLLTSANPNQRSMVVSELAKACEFGFFMVCTLCN